MTPPSPTPQAEELLPCSFCGCNNSTTRAVEGETWVECNECGAETNKFPKSFAMAITAWNRRPSSPAASTADSMVNDADLESALAFWTEDSGPHGQTVRAFALEIQRLRGIANNDARDGARYRWLRKGDGAEIVASHYGTELDVAIDSAMSKERT